MRFDQAPLGGASNDLPTDDPVFILEQIAEQAEAGGADRRLDAAICRLVDLPQCLAPDCDAEVLARIIDRVERGEWDQDPSVPFYTTSLDAALTLVPEGFDWLRLGPVTMTVYPVQHDPKAWAHHIEATGATPALALCAAALRARASLARQMAKGVA